MCNIKNKKKSQNGQKDTDEEKQLPHIVYFAQRNLLNRETSYIHKWNWNVMIIQI